MVDYAMHVGGALKDIPVALTRTDGGTGSCLVSSGLPLPPGYLQPADAGQVTLWIGGAEQTVYTEVLKGLHPDGSARVVLIQSTQTISDGSPVTATVRIGRLQLQTTTKSTVTLDVTADVPEAMVNPTDESYRIACRLLTPIIRSSEVPTTSPWSSLTSTLTSNWSTYTSGAQSWATDNKPERLRFGALYWMMTGDIDYAVGGIRSATEYLDSYVTPNSGQIPPHNWFPASCLLHYWLTGDEQGRTQLINNALYHDGLYYPDYFAAGITNRYTESRIWSRTFDSYRYAWLLEDTSNPATGGTDTYDTWLELCEGMIQSKIDAVESGGDQWLNQVQDDPNAEVDAQSNFMVGFMHAAIMEYFEHYPSSAKKSAWLTILKDSVDFLIDNEWSASDEGYYYWSDGTGSWHTTAHVDKVPVSSGWFANNIINACIAYAYWLGGTPSRTQAQLATQIEAGVTGWLNNWSTEKEWNQGYTVVFQAIYYRFAA